MEAQVKYHDFIPVAVEPIAACLQAAALTFGSTIKIAIPIIGEAKLNSITYTGIPAVFTTNLVTYTACPCVMITSIAHYFAAMTAKVKHIPAVALDAFVNIIPFNIIIKFLKIYAEMTFIIEEY